VQIPSERVQLEFRRRSVPLPASIKASDKLRTFLALKNLVQSFSLCWVQTCVALLATTYQYTSAKSIYFQILFSIAINSHYWPTHYATTTTGYG